MACINPDGTLTPSAKVILSAVQKPSTPEDVQQATELPLFRIRSSFRELLAAGLIEEQEGKYVITEEGRQKITT